MNEEQKKKLVNLALSGEEQTDVTLSEDEIEKLHKKGVETWTLDKEQNPVLVDRLGYVPREKIIAKGIANGELLERFRRSDAYAKTFDISGDDNLPIEPDVSRLDSMEIDDLRLSNQSRIDYLQAELKKAVNAQKQAESQSKPVIKEEKQVLNDIEK